ncbi:MAG: NAD(P)H-hydrate dehydratase [Planctomycetota bacterium]
MIPIPQEISSLPLLPTRQADSHKGDYGRALLIGGSRGMFGAIALAGMGALRGGAGLVRVVTGSRCQTTVAALEPCYMTVALPDDDEGRLTSYGLDALERLAEQSTCTGCGPGLGQSQELNRIVSKLYGKITPTLVLDADGLNAMAAAQNSCAWHAGPRILTPHPVEFRRLQGNDRLPLDRLAEGAVEWAGQRKVILVLKGHRTLVTDGERSFWNPTGNPGMATGGSGDVLTGLITALVCQAMDPWEAAVLGVFLHGLAGDLAALDLGQHSLIARDLVTYLPAAFLKLQAWQQGATSTTQEAASGLSISSPAIATAASDRLCN